MSFNKIDLNVSFINSNATNQVSIFVAMSLVLGIFIHYDFIEHYVEIFPISR